MIRASAILLRVEKGEALGRSFFSRRVIVYLALFDQRPVTSWHTGVKTRIDKRAVHCGRASIRRVYVCMYVSRVMQNLIRYMDERGHATKFRGAISFQRRGHLKELEMGGWREGDFPRTVRNEFSQNTKIELDISLKWKRGIKFCWNNLSKKKSKFTFVRGDRKTGGGVSPLL